MADDRTLPFYQRAYHNYQDAMESLQAIITQEENAEQTDPLAVTERKEVTIELSAGGPADGYKIYFNVDGTPEEGYYFFADWFEYEEIKLKPYELDRVVDIYNLYF